MQADNTTKMQGVAKDNEKILKENRNPILSRK